MKSILKRTKKGTRGQSLVEFAFVGVILFTLLLGIIDAGRLLFTYSVISNAAQEGVHYAFIRPHDIISSSEATQAAATSVAMGTPTYIPAQVVPDGACNVYDKTREEVFGLTKTDVQVVTWYDNGAGTPVAVTASTITDVVRPSTGNRAVVEASYHFDFLVPYFKIFLPNGINVKMRSARTILSGGGDPSNCTVNYTPVPTNTPLATGTATGTATSTGTPTSTSTITASGTSTLTSTRTQTATPTKTGTVTGTSTITGTPTMTGTPTKTGTATKTGTRTNTPTITRTPTRTGTATKTGTPTKTGTRTKTPTVTRTPTKTYTPTNTGTHTKTPTVTGTPTWTGTPTNTPTPALVIAQMAVRKANGTGKPIDVQVTVTDMWGAPITGATVNGSATGPSGSTWSGPLTETVGGLYWACQVGSFNGSGGGNVTVTVTASKSGYAAGSRTASDQVGTLCP